MTVSLIARAVCDDADALRFLEDIATVLHAWDDMIDRDSPLSDDEVHRAFWLALIEIPNNAFYARHRAQLQPILVSAIANWRIANEIERGRVGANAELLKIAFIIRSTYVDLATMCAILIGGLEWGVEQGCLLREWIHNETFNGYLANLHTEVETRKEGAKHGL